MPDCPNLIPGDHNRGNVTPSLANLHPLKHCGFGWIEQSTRTTIYTEQQEKQAERPNTELEVTDSPKSLFYTFEPRGNPLKLVLIIR